MTKAGNLLRSDDEVAHRGGRYDGENEQIEQWPSLHDVESMRPFDPDAVLLSGQASPAVAICRFAEPDPA